MASGLDGDWQVHRTGGFLPPLIGVRKHIEGDRGSTSLGPLPGVPFDVVGNELRYRRPVPLASTPLRIARPVAR